MSKADELERDIKSTFLTSEDLKAMSVDHREKSFAARQVAYDAIAALRESEASHKHYAKGMQNWKETAQEKDKQILALRAERDLLATDLQAKTAHNVMETARADDNAAERDRLRTQLHAVTSVGEMSYMDEVEAERDRLRAAVADQLCSFDCAAWVSNTHHVTDMCDCWKRKALDEKEGG